jgi:hypothetical protein
MLQTCRFSSIAQNQDNFGGRTRPERPQECLEVAAAPGNSHGYAHRHGGGK